MTTIAVATTTGLGRRWVDRAARVLPVVTLASFLALVAGMAVGFRPLVVHSGSMSPSVNGGDVVVTRMVKPAEVRVGDIVTFRDPSREQRLVTHRVREVHREAESFSFVTRGDTNTGVERWSIDADGTLGRLSLRIPLVGYAIGWLGTAAVKAALLAVGALVLAIAAVRRIWS